MVETCKKKIERLCKVYRGLNYKKLLVVVGKTTKKGLDSIVQKLKYSMKWILDQLQKSALND